MNKKQNKKQIASMNAMKAQIHFNHLSFQTEIDKIPFQNESRSRRNRFSFCIFKKTKIKVIVNKIPNKYHNIQFLCR